VLGNNVLSTPMIVDDPFFRYRSLERGGGLQRPRRYVRLAREFNVELTTVAWASTSYNLVLALFVVLPRTPQPGAVFDCSSRPRRMRLRADAAAPATRPSTARAAC
jgi:hypothetical protein